MKLQDMKFKIGEIVYYIKPVYGEHIVLRFKSDQVLLGTQKLGGEGLDKFWTHIDKIVKK